jgi:hypothetical protein
MRATGYRMVDLLVERVAGVREWPALTRASPAEMRERLHGPAPEAGTRCDVLLATLERDVLAHIGRVDQPAYFAFIPGSSRASSSASSRRSTGAPTTATRGSPRWWPRATCAWPG